MKPVLAIILLILVSINIGISFSKRPLYSNLYLVLSTLLFIAGGIGTIVVRYDLLRAIERRSYLEPAFLDWVLERYDTYAFWSLAIEAIMIVIMIVLLIIKRAEQHVLWGAGITLFTVVVICASLIVTINYGLSTLNKEFDVAKYILNLAICEWLLLYLPLIMKRIFKKRALRPPYHQQL